MNLLEYIFWFGVLAVGYTYLGYGLIGWVLINLRGPYKDKRSADPNVELPTIALVIPCFNEAEGILLKVADCRQLNYPKDKLRLIFVADGSTDGTEQILMAMPDIEVLFKHERKGKAAAMNHAMEIVREPLVVFSDANTQISRDSLLHIIRHYQDLEIGGVACEKRIIRKASESASSAGEGIYWQYESFLKRCDAGLKTIIGAAGELMSVRSDLYRPIPEDTILDDFMLSMKIVEQGYIMAYEPNAFAEEYASANIQEELKRKIRISAGGWQALFRLKHLLNPFRDFWVSFIFWSHRVMRWSLGPFFFFALVPLNILLFKEAKIYMIFAFLFLIYFILVLLGRLLANTSLRIQWIFVPYYFFIMNFAVIAGFLRFLNKKQSVNWEKSIRSVQS